MTRVLIKELILGVIILVVGLVTFAHFELSIFKKWIIFSVLTTGFMMLSTLLLNLVKMIKPEMIGIVFIIAILLFQLILVIILFVFLEPENVNHRITAKSATVVYLISLGVDIYWKIRWIFPEKKRKRLKVNRHDDF